MIREYDPGRFSVTVARPPWGRFWMRTTTPPDPPAPRLATSANAPDTPRGSAATSLIRRSPVGVTFTSTYAV